MKPTRTTQPYRRKSVRPVGPALSAMLRGKPAYRAHPLEAKRKLRRYQRANAASVRRGRA
jgi:hypothetical protein